MSSLASPLQTPLHDWHLAHKGRLTRFSGWLMPIQYGSIIDEHHQTRHGVGLFDISHMGRLLIDGKDASRLLERVLTRRVADMNPGQVRYSLVCNERGGVLDDVLVYQVELPEGGLSGYGLVVNAGNRDKVVSWLRQHATSLAVEIHDATLKYAMLSVQGPRAIELLDTLSDCELTSLRYYSGLMTRICSYRAFVSRTGYTGEDGCEIICDANDVLAIWSQLVELAQEMGGGPVGLAARDILRQEAAMPLYGHELTEEINPVQAGLSFAVNLRNRDFVGRDAIALLQNSRDQPVRIGLQVEGKRAARDGSPILHDTQLVGHVTSGTYSPTFQRPIAMGYVKPTSAALGGALTVDIRGSLRAAQVVPLPFYERGR